MSSEIALETEDSRRLIADRGRTTALRLAFGVTGCFAVVEALNWDATFLAPLLASSMLIKLQRAPTLVQGIGLVLLFVISTGIVMMITAAFIASPAVLILALSLLLYLSFYAHRLGAPPLATLLLQVSAVALPTVAVLSPDGANSFAATLIGAAIVALLAVWVSFAAFPNSSLTAPGDQASPATTRDEPFNAARRAFRDTMVLFPLLTWYILDATQTAVVVLIIALTLLRTPDDDFARSDISNLVLGNLVGGAAAALVYQMVALGNSLIFFVLVCLASTLIFAARIVMARRTSLYSTALATFILLLGIGMSPLPGGTGEAFFSRLIYVIAASIYTLAAMHVLSNESRAPSPKRLTGAVGH